MSSHSLALTPYLLILCTLFCPPALLGQDPTGVSSDDSLDVLGEVQPDLVGDSTGPEDNDADAATETGSETPARVGGEESGEAPSTDSEAESVAGDDASLSPASLSPAGPSPAGPSPAGPQSPVTDQPENARPQVGEDEDEQSVPNETNSSPTPSDPQDSTNPPESPPSSLFYDFQTNLLLGVVLAALAIASIVGQYLTRQSNETVNPALVRRFKQRVNAWWFMCAILVFGVYLRMTVLLFGVVSFWALREFITMAPTRRGDHRALFWALVVFTPLQYVLIALEGSGLTWLPSGKLIDFYGLYSILIPVYASLYVPARIAIAGDHKRFLERSAQITIGLLICVYSLSYAPALINLDLRSSDGSPWTGSPVGLLFFFILVSQLSDILQWTWGQIVGKKYIAPEVSSGRTWEGFAGGTLSTGLVGAGLWWVTPFTFYESACMSMVIGVMGMFGGMTMSAIKRDRGVNDYGTLVLGHAGVLDRIDTLCFAAPVFYHLTRFFYT